MKKKVSKSVEFTAVWLSRVILAGAAFTGFVTLLGGIDTVIAYPLAALLTLFLIKEQL